MTNADTTFDGISTFLRDLHSELQSKGLSVIMASVNVFADELIWTIYLNSAMMETLTELLQQRNQNKKS